MICTDDAGDFLGVCFRFAARKLEVQVLLFTGDDTEEDAADRFLFSHLSFGAHSALQWRQQWAKLFFGKNKYSYLKLCETLERS